MVNETTISITVPDDVEMIYILGEEDKILSIIKKSFSTRIVIRGNEIELFGDTPETNDLAKLFSDMIEQIQDGTTPDARYISQRIDLIKEHKTKPQDLNKDVLLEHGKKRVSPKTTGQKRYADAIRANTITFGIGPAGTGKTYLAVALAVAALINKEVQRIILTRPVVETGENLGFLPGDLLEKIDPHFRPLHDALGDMVGTDRVSQWIENGAIENVPLAYMRGRTFNDSFVILDEAQNTTQEQMKMFLTRLGFKSKMVITGDATQIDLPKGISGLKQARLYLEGIEDISFCDLTAKDIVRHDLVSRIVAAYESAEPQRDHKLILS